MQSICCELAGFHPPEFPTGKLYRDTKWPVDTMNSLFEIVANKRLIACILVSGIRVFILEFENIELPMRCLVLYFTVLYCFVFYCFKLCCIVLDSLVLYCIVLYYIVLYCIVLYHIVLYPIVSNLDSNINRIFLL